MIIGAHSIIYSANPEADRGFLRDVLELPSVDVGEGWLIFGLPPAEVAVHPSDENLRCGAEPGLGITDPGDAARGREARRLSAAARTAEDDESGLRCEEERETRGEETRRNREAQSEEESRKRPPFLNTGGIGKGPFQAKT